MLTLDQLKRSRKLANRCFLCEEDEKSIDHLLVHCPSAWMLWFLFLALVGFSWVFPSSVSQNPFVLARSLGWKEAKEGLDSSPSMLILDYLVGKDQGCLRE